MGVIPSSIFRFGVDAAFLGGLGFEGIHKSGAHECMAIRTSDESGSASR